MRYTFFNMPVLTPVLRLVAVGFLNVLGYRPSGELPDVPKCVLVAAPHTSNWDFVLLLAFGLYYRVQPSWMGKASLFRWPFGGLFRWLGGISVDRNRAATVVQEAVAAFRDRDRMMLVVAPEGTRKYVEAWKSGFYRIAMHAEVPILMSFLDYRKRAGGFGPLFHATGDMDRDMEAFRAFYAGITGKHPDQFGPPAVARRG